MKPSPAQSTEIVELVLERTGRARLTISGTSMQPLLSAGMVIDIEPLTQPPRIGDILVFKSQRGLVAHRLVGGERFTFRAFSGMVAQPGTLDNPAPFITGGDALPHRSEEVPRHLVVGRVSAVWTSAEPDARRIDDARFRRHGSVIARTRTARRLFVTGRAYAALLLADPARVAPPRAFTALVAATHRLERRQYDAGVALLASVPLPNTIDMARRHHASGLVSRWLDEAVEAGVPVPHDMREAFRRIRWTNALQAGRILTCVRDVRDKLTAAGIPLILLKGGARLAANEPGADLQFSGDLDVIVPAGMADHALAALRAAGYRDVRPEHERARYATLEHREPLYSPCFDVPVEVHVTLAAPALVSGRLDYAALAPFAQRRCGPAGDVYVLDPVLSAVHLAYHARDLQVWRDIVLLSRMLRAFDSAARLRFDAYIGAEKWDGLRLAGAVAAADAIAFGRSDVPRAVKGYLLWAEVREDLPGLLARAELIEALAGRCPRLLLHRGRFRRDAVAVARVLARNLALIPPLVRIARRRPRGSAVLELPAG